jgi:osmotically-inducible protein OsmY
VAQAGNCKSACLQGDDFPMICNPFQRTLQKLRRFTLALAALALVFAAAPAMHAQANDAQVQAEVQKALNKSRFKNVHIDVANGVVTLTGSVEYYGDKQDADSRVHHVKTVGAVRNEIQVGNGAATVSDAVIQQKLGEKIAYDRVGYGTTPFNAIEVHVQNGVVTLSGHAYGPSDKDSALSLAKYYPGVKDVIDDIEVDPLSPMDDRIRMEEARSIYSFPMLSKYSMDPAKPIRITVINGNVILSGTVENQTEKDMATLRANAVSGVFKVVNNLQVVNPTPAK